MPKFIVAILTAIGNFYYNHFTQQKETRQDRKHREAREERARARAEKAELIFKNELAEKQARKDSFELRKLEFHQLAKVMEHYFTLKGSLPIHPLRIPHFYKIEIIPLRTFSREHTFIYAYVACKGCNGATVLLYNPTTAAKYSAISLFNGNYVRIDKPGKDTKVSVLQRAERIFEPIRTQLDAA